ncbi:MAG: asparaginase, partial [Jeotgalicoccus sp.]|nr:asparaginase [Jeotgalicoccus sp.]
MSHIKLLTTGGTIASKRDPVTGLQQTGLISGEELAEKLDLHDDINISVEEIIKVSSSAITFENLITIKDAVLKALSDDEVDGIVLTHGTDTLEETTYFLSLMIPAGKAVVVTGSQRGPELVGTDAYANLQDAITLAADANAAKIGVSVLFNSKIFMPRFVKKISAMNVDGFGGGGTGYLGLVDGHNVKIYQYPAQDNTYEIEGELPEVDIIKCALGTDAKFIDCAIDHKVAGLVIETMGRGHANDFVAAGVKRAVDAGIKVVITSASDEGDVKVAYDFSGGISQFEKDGAINGGS